MTDAEQQPSPKLPPLTKKSTEVDRIIWETDEADGGISIIGGVRIPPQAPADEPTSTKD